MRLIQAGQRETVLRTVEKAGLNRYFFEMANIRERVSWVGENKEANTGKAIEAVRMAIMKVMEDKFLYLSCFFLPRHVRKLLECGTLVSNINGY